MRCVVYVLAISLCLTAGPAVAWGEETAHQELPQGRLDGLNEFIPKMLEAWKVPGLAVAVVKDGDVIFSKGYGYRDREKQLPVTPKTLFAIGSITKSFVATDLGMLADEGKLDWDKPVRTYLPDFALHDPIATLEMTPRDLVTHRSGLPRHDSLWYGTPLSRNQLYHRLRYLPPSKSFRSTYQYQNLMFMTAGYLAGEVHGTSWEELTRQRILEPLGMQRTNFSVTESQKDDDFATPYYRHRDEVGTVPFRNIDAIAPAGAINSCIEEMARYLQFHLAKGKCGDQRLLSQEMAEQMQSPQMVIPGKLEFDEVGHSSYGMGFTITTYRGHKVVRHGGAIDGFIANLAFMPRKDFGVVVLSNLSGFNPVPGIVTDNVFDHLLDLEPIDWHGRMVLRFATSRQESDEKKNQIHAQRKSDTAPSHALLDYTGTYEHPGYGTIEIGYDGAGLTLRFYDVTVALNHFHYDVFRAAEHPMHRLGESMITFGMDKKGEIVSVAVPLEPQVADVEFDRITEKKAGPAEVAYDVLILGGQVVDGTGNAAFAGDVAIRGDRIARIMPAGMLAAAKAAQRVEARGLVVAPGFIDIQSHSRGALLSGDGRVIGKVTQGVTTEILGEGWTNAPANEKTIGLTADPEAAELAKQFSGPRGFDKWLRAMQSHGTSVNFGSFLGSATVRAYVKGAAQGSPTADELEQMRGLVRCAMKDGAFGLASALIYPPDNFVATGDLIELSKVMAPYGGVYITHMRSEADNLLEAIDEAIEIGRKGRVPVEIYHLKAAGRRNWHKAPLAVARIEAARAEGLDVGADMYPYIAGATGLTACLPPSASADGKLFENLADPEMRAKIRQEVLDPQTDWENLGELATPDGVLVLGLEKEENKQYAGKRLSEIAAMQNKHWVDAAMDLILSERQRIGTIYFMMSEENVAIQMRQPWIKFGTDASGHDPENPDGLVHPRSYGTYPRILGKYVREERVMRLEEAIRKMSSAVAARLSIPDRGLLREGFYADVVVFNPDTITDRATFEQPHQTSVGVHHVFVNGSAVVCDGKHTGAKPGRIVRGPGWNAQ